MRCYRKTGSVYERVTRLINVGAVNTPKWYDVFKRYPPPAKINYGRPEKFIFPEEKLYEKFLRRNPIMVKEKVDPLKENATTAMRFSQQQWIYMSGHYMEEEEAYARCMNEFKIQIKTFEETIKVPKEKYKKKMTLQQVVDVMQQRRSSILDTTFDDRERGITKNDLLKQLEILKSKGRTEEDVKQFTKDLKNYAMQKQDVDLDDMPWRKHDPPTLEEVLKYEPKNTEKDIAGEKNLGMGPFSHYLSKSKIQDKQQEIIESQVPDALQKYNSEKALQFRKHMRFLNISEMLIPKDGYPEEERDMEAGFDEDTSDLPSNRMVQEFVADFEYFGSMTAEWEKEFAKYQEAEGDAKEISESVDQ